MALPNTAPHKAVAGDCGFVMLIITFNHGHLVWVSSPTLVRVDTWLGILHVHCLFSWAAQVRQSQHYNLWPCEVCLPPTISICHALHWPSTLPFTPFSFDTCRQMFDFLVCSLPNFVVLLSAGCYACDLLSVHDLFQVLFNGIPLNKMSVSMTMNGAVLPILAM